MNNSKSGLSATTQGVVRAINSGVVIAACLWLIAFSVTVSEASPLGRTALMAKFDSMDQAINKGEGYSNNTNEAGNLAWGESYLLEAYLDMYEATSDGRYLASFARHADRIIGNTDARRGITDYKGRSLAGWSATRYSLDGQRVVWLVHTGMITYPLVRFAYLVDRNGLDVFRAQAQSYVEVAKAALSVFDNNWVYDSVTGEGYYYFSADDPIGGNGAGFQMPLPFNQQLAAGRAYIMLHKVTSSVQYRRKAEALARQFRGNLARDNGAYTWLYWYGDGLKVSKGVEDISHGAIDLDFAILANRYGLVFSRVDMIRFLRTYTQKVRKQGGLADRVDGIGLNTYRTAGGRWLELARFSMLPWRDVEAAVPTISSGHPEVMLGVAKLLKYYDRWK